VAKSTNAALTRTEWAQVWGAVGSVQAAASVALESALASGVDPELLDDEVPPDPLDPPELLAPPLDDDPPPDPLDDEEMPPPDDDVPEPPEDPEDPEDVDPPDPLLPLEPDPASSAGCGALPAQFAITAMPDDTTASPATRSQDHLHMANSPRA
jgi:hypothetical protein